VAVDLKLAVVTAVLGLLTAGVLALVNSWVNTRAGTDENLRARRLEYYPTLWGATAAVSRWPREPVTRTRLDELHKQLRTWYFGGGGIFLSELARARYGDVQTLIDALLKHKGGSTDLLSADRYEDLMETASSLRTALTEDLDTRRKKSLWETNRRSRWHASAKRAAQARISAATNSTPAFVPKASSRPGP
jgi:hypothetical protein